MSFYQRTLVSTAPKATLLIRLLVGLVFLSEGIQKFLFPASLGSGRFVKIGIPAPQGHGTVCGRYRNPMRVASRIGLAEQTGDYPTSGSDFGRYRFH